MDIVLPDISHLGYVWFISMNFEDSRKNKIRSFDVYIHPWIATNTLNQDIMRMYDVPELALQGTLDEMYKELVTLPFLGFSKL